MTIDDLLAAEIVTADGEVRHVDDEHDPDLFWAIRGGGGNFGVATRLRFRLHEVPTIVGGILILPATTDAIASFIAEALDAPDELSTIANVMPAPPMPFVPEELHGTPVILAMLTYAGDTDAGERAVAPFRAIATPIADMLRPMTYPEMYMPEEGDYHPISSVRSMLVDEIDASSAGTILEHLDTSTAQMAVAQLRVLGGAMARVPAEATAFAHRDRRIMVNVATIYERAEDRPVHEAVGRGPRDGAPTRRDRRLRQLPGRRRRGAGPRGLPRRDLGAARLDQGPLRPDEPVPLQPEHPAGDLIVSRRSDGRRRCGWCDPRPRARRRRASR